MNRMIIIVKLKPLLIVNNDSVYDLDIGDPIVNKLLQDRISDDYINVKEIMRTSLDVDLKILDYSYEIYDHGFIYVTMIKNDHKQFTLEDHSEIIDRVDSRGHLAADTWMEGDIRILLDYELDTTKYAMNDFIEMGLHVIEVFDLK